MGFKWEGGGDRVGGEAACARSTACATSFVACPLVRRRVKPMSERHAQEQARPESLPCFVFTLFRRRKETLVKRIILIPARLICV